MDPTDITVTIPAALYLALLAEADREGLCVEDIIIDALAKRYDFDVPPEWN